MQSLCCKWFIWSRKRYLKTSLEFHDGSTITHVCQCQLTISTVSTFCFADIYVWPLQSKMEICRPHNRKSLPMKTNSVEKIASNSDSSQYIIQLNTHHDANGIASTMIHTQHIVYDVTSLGSIWFGLVLMVRSILISISVKRIKWKSNVELEPSFSVFGSCVFAFAIRPLSIST